MRRCRAAVTRSRSRIHKDESVSVEDNGAGIPVDIQKQTGLPAVTVVMTKLHAGGKFGGGGYKVSVVSTVWVSARSMR